MAIKSVKDGLRQAREKRREANARKRVATPDKKAVKPPRKVAAPEPRKKRPSTLSGLKTAGSHFTGNVGKGARAAGSLARRAFNFSKAKGRKQGTITTRPRRSPKK